jgi:hypothetical protein
MAFRLSGFHDIQQRSVIPGTEQINGPPEIAATGLAFDSKAVFVLASPEASTGTTPPTLFGRFTK